MTKHRTAQHKWNLEKIVQMNFFTKQKQIHRYREQMHGLQVGEGMINLKIGIDIYILLCIK